MLNETSAANFEIGTVLQRSDAVARGIGEHQLDAAATLGRGWRGNFGEDEVRGAVFLQQAGGLACLRVADECGRRAGSAVCCVTPAIFSASEFATATWPSTRVKNIG